MLSVPSTGIAGILPHLRASARHTLFEQAVLRGYVRRKGVPEAVFIGTLAAVGGRGLFDGHHGCRVPLGHAFLMKTTDARVERDGVPIGLGLVACRRIAPPLYGKPCAVGRSELAPDAEGPYASEEFEPAAPHRVGRATQAEVVIPAARFDHPVEGAPGSPSTSFLDERYGIVQAEAELVSVPAGE